MVDKFSVLISVYNKESPKYFEEALKSIWDFQTLKPSQIVIVKDGPLNLELNLTIEKFSENAPVKLIEFEHNMGLGIALAEGLKRCDNDLIARMDSDDIASPNRFEKQINYLKSNPDISLLSSHIAEFINDPSMTTSIRKVPIANSDILKFAKKRNPMNHMVVMYKKSAVLDAGNYQPFPGYEDYYLWVRMLLKGYSAANLNDNLVYARIGNNMIARRQGIKFFNEEIRLQKEFLRLHFINVFDFIQNILFRALPRLMPIFILKIIYRFLRK